jgi:hypothetical protein
MATVRNNERQGTIPAQRGPDRDSLRVAAPAGAEVAHRGSLARARATGALEPVANPVLAPPVIPTQSAPPLVESLAPDVASRHAEAPTRIAATRRSTRLTLVVTSAALVVALVVAGVVVSVQSSARAAELVRVEARTALEVAARADDQNLVRSADRAVMQAATANQRAAQVAAAGAVVAAAQATLAATPNAGDGPRSALQAAMDALNSVLATTGSGTSVATLRTVAAAVPAGQQAALDAQTAWQVAEDARVAAEQAAAQKAAAEQAAAQAAQTKAVKPAAARTVKSAPAAAAPAAAAAAPAGVGDVFSAGTIGAELNAYRASQGLGALAIVSSGARITHASQMAASDSIWHSTVRSMAEIVGRVSPASASAMISAYANSPGHNAIMLGSYSTAYVGAVTYDGWLYTSIQFG